MNDLPTPNYPDYNHTKYGDKPGQLWTANEQCRLLLRDKAATFFDTYNTYSKNNITVINLLNVSIHFQVVSFLGEKTQHIFNETF
jgi:hypothetical protein